MRLISTFPLRATSYRFFIVEITFALPKVCSLLFDLRGYVGVFSIENALRKGKFTYSRKIIIVNSNEMSTDLVAYWSVPFQGILYEIEFEHGTVSGKRCVRVNGKEILRREWMFKLVGSEKFEIKGVTFEIKIDPATTFAYSYTLEINGLQYEKYTEKQSQMNKTWLAELDDEIYRVVMEKETLDVWANGQKLETQGEFVDDGSELHFVLGKNPAYIKTVSSGKRREGIIHNLIVNDTVIPETLDQNL